MKPIRWIFILSSIIGLGGLGVSFYLMFWGPDAIPIEGRSLQDLLTSGDILPVIVIPIVLLIAVVSMIPFFRIMFPSEIKNGVKTSATVLKVWDTGVSINDNPQVGLLLEVRTIEGSTYQVETKTLVSRLNAALVQPGTTAEVIYDPEKPQRIKVEMIHIQDLAAAAPVDASDRMEELKDLRQKGLITEEEYKIKREEILKAL